MSEKLCTLRTKGGGGGGATWVETILWANPSPTSAFAAQTVTLSDDINNYDYIGFYYKYGTTTDGLNDPMFTCTTVDKFKTSLGNNSTRHNIVTLGNKSASNNTWTRTVRYASDTSIEFSLSYVSNTSGNENVSNIPLQVVGISKGRVPSYKTVKDFIHAKVFDSGLPEIDTYTVMGNRVTVTEGKVVADAVTHKVYMYFDFTTNSAFGSASDWSSLLQFTSASVPYFPMLTANSRQNSTALITDDTSDVSTKQFAWGYATTSYPYRLLLTYGQTVRANEHYIVYGEYTYR